jgi:hypothetical protein
MIVRCGGNIRCIVIAYENAITRPSDRNAGLAQKYINKPLIQIAFIHPSNLHDNNVKPQLTY